MPPLAYLFLVLVVCGVVAALIRQAPDSLLAEPYKSWLVYLVLIIAVLAVLAFFGVLPAFLSGITSGLTLPRRQ